MQIVLHLSITRRACVLDVPCGNGFYSRLLAERLGRSGRIDCVDLCGDYLASTRRRLRGVSCMWQVQSADAYALPFGDNRFDLVWCAQSLISLSDGAAAVAEMKRVLRPGGTLAVLENDLFHQVLLPWPVELEVAIQRAIQVNMKVRFGSSSKVAPVRRLPELLEFAGLQGCRKRTFAADRQAPWSATVRRFLKLHVKDLHRMVGSHLPVKSREAFRRFVDPERSDFLFADKAMDFTCLNFLYESVKPG